MAALLASCAAPVATVKVEPRVARPIFHLAPTAPRGWINDPNGPLLHNGTYHLFWQNVPNSSEWSWGLGWGHATSKDLVQWQPQPVALEPSLGGLDRHGCFSGCATVDVDGVPSILYTGVIRKTPEELEPGGSHQHEAQLLAVAADPDDPELKEWVKLPGPFLPQPAAALQLTGWRDPFILERPCGSSPCWYVMVGAGVKGKCGTALVYRNRDLKSGWEYVGPLCESPAAAMHTMWECPIMAQLSNRPPVAIATAGPGATNGHMNGHSAMYSTNGHMNGHTSSSSSSSSQAISRHMLCVSPDYCVNVPLCYLGSYAAGRFELDAAAPPQRLDLGDILYAPNVLTDAQGRTVLWAWMQEKQQLRPAGSYDSACCLCVPRLLFLSPDGTRLLQEPLPELAALRQQHNAWHIGSTAGKASSLTTAAGGSGGGDAFEAPLALQPGVPLQLGSSSSSSHVDLELTLQRGEAESVVLLLQPFEGLPGAAGAGIAYCWATDTLQVIHSTDPATLEAVAAMPVPTPAFKQLPGPTPEQAAAEAAAAAAQAVATGVPMRCGGALLRGRSAPTASSNGSGISNTSSSISSSKTANLQSEIGCAAAAGDVPAELKLRVLIDGSCVEVFAAGQALGTRVYRGDQHPLDYVASTAELAIAAGMGSLAQTAESAAAGALVAEGGTVRSAGAGSSSSRGEIQLVCFGDGPAQLISASVWGMNSMWAPDAAAAKQQQQQLEELAPAAATAASQVLQGLVAAEAAAVASAAAATMVLPVGELSMAVQMPGVEGEAAAAAALSPRGAAAVTVEAS